MLEPSKAQCCRCKALDYYEAMIVIDFFVVDADSYVGKVVICRNCRQPLLDWIEAGRLAGETRIFTATDTI